MPHLSNSFLQAVLSKTLVFGWPTKPVGHEESPEERFGFPHLHGCDFRGKPASDAAFGLNCLDLFFQRNLSSL
jgi:hypothetical protein